MISKILVFLSSTSQRNAERVALRQALTGPYEFYLYEEDRARGTNPEAHCRTMIKQSDAFLGLLGPEYGSLFPGSQPPKSIVEWELDTALALGHTEIHPFIKQLSPGESYEPEQARFVSRVRNFGGGSWCKFYANSQQLVELASSSLQRWLSEFFVRAKENRERRRRVLVPMLMVSSVLGISLLAVVVAMALRGELFRTPTVALSGMAVVFVAFSGLIVYWLYGGDYE